MRRLIGMMHREESYPHTYLVTGPLHATIDGVHTLCGKGGNRNWSYPMLEQGKHLENFIACRACCRQMVQAWSQDLNIKIAITDKDITLTAGNDVWIFRGVRRWHDAIKYLRECQVEAVVSVG